MTGQSKVPPFQPLEWQIEPWRDTSKILLLTGSAGGGKSKLAAEKVHGYCLRYPGATALVLRKAYAYAAKSILPFLNQTVIGDDPRVEYKRARRMFVYSNGSVIYAGGMLNDKQREAIRSLGGEGRVGIVWMEEANAFTEQDFNEVLARMRGVAAPWTQVILSTNPDRPTHWIKQRLIDGGEASVYYSSAVQNPHNLAEYIDTLNSLTGVLKQRLADGQWIQAEGAVYTEWIERKHLKDADEVPSFSRHVGGIDWGYTNPGVLQIWGVRGLDDSMWLVHEVYRSGETDDWWLERALWAQEQFDVEAWVCDPSEPAYIEKFRRAGLNAVGAFNEVMPGITNVKARIADDRLVISRGALRGVDGALKEAHKPTCTAQEFAGYVWADKKAKESPVKEDDHGMDALRYAAAYVDGLGRKRRKKTAGLGW